MRRLLRALSTTISLAVEAYLRDATIALERTGSNIRTGLTLVEAVKADDLNSRLLAGVGDAESAHEIRLMALRLMECGVTEDEIQPLLAHWHRTRFLDVTIDDVMKAALMRHRGERIELPDMVHVHHHDIEAHAASFNEGYETAMAQHLQPAADQTEAHDWLVEQKAAAWSAGVGTALNHAITNEDGITLRLQHTDDRPWVNPYSDEPYPTPDQEARS